MSSPRPRETVVPPGSRAQALLPGADFHDAWTITTRAGERSALAHFIAAARRTPRWVDACMSLRNRAARVVGLKHLGDLSQLSALKEAEDYRVGDRVGIFTLFETGFDEVLLGDRDKHLDVVLSVHRQAGAGPDAGLERVTVTTVVHVKNMLGRLYMVPVRPMHRLIAPAVLAALGDSANASDNASAAH